MVCTWLKAEFQQVNANEVGLFAIFDCYSGDDDGLL